MTVSIVQLKDPSDEFNYKTTVNIRGREFFSYHDMRDEAIKYAQDMQDSSCLGFFRRRIDHWDKCKCKKCQEKVKKSREDFDYMFGELCLKP